MKPPLILMSILVIVCTVSAQTIKPAVKVEPAFIEYNQKTVKAKRLIVSSEIPMHIDSAWASVRTPALLQFVAKGMIRFEPVEGDFPKQWQEGETYSVKMHLFGFLPFGGTHFLFVEKIDDTKYEIATREWDKAAKVWNHKILMRSLGNQKLYYEDSITIYGGIMTGFITSFAKRFYLHRQKKWQIVAKENLKFAE